MTGQQLKLGLAPLALAALAACGGNPPPAEPAPQAPPAAQPAPAAAPAAPTPAAAPAPAARAAAAAPAAAPAARDRLAGEWEWTASMGGEAYSGTMTFESRPDGYAGLLRVAGLFDGTLRVVTLAATGVRAIWDSPEGELVMNAVFTDAQTLTGTVDVASAGATASILARRR